MKTSEKVVFVVDARDLDINCARLVSEPSPSVKMVRFKHRSRGVEVPSMLCHETLGDAKAWLLKHIRLLANNVEGLEYDEEDFSVS